MMSHRPFIYGRCHTDNKTGAQIRADFPRPDFVNDPTFAPAVAAALEKLGLPVPQAEEIFRGTHHDILFLDSHGVVVRIGPTDVESLIHPAILQPLGWVDKVANHDGYDLAITLHPGIEIYKYAVNNKNSYDLDNVARYLVQSGHQSADVIGGNMGIIRVRREGREVAVPVVLDIDSEFNGRIKRFYDTRPGLQDLVATGVSIPRAMRQLLDTTSPVPGMAEDMCAAFDTHQPLRHMFWRAFPSAATGRVGDVNHITPDQDLRTAFWDQCAALTETPRNMVVHDWLSRVSPDGTPLWEKQETRISDLFLYRGWTGAKADLQPRYVGQRKEWAGYLDIVTEDPDLLPDLPLRLRVSRQFMAQAIERRSECAAYLTPEMADDRDFIENLCLNEHDKLTYCSERLRGDREFVLAHLRHAGLYDFAAPALRDDPVFVRRAILRFPALVTKLPEHLAQDGNFLRGLIADAPAAYGALTVKQRNNRDLALIVAQATPLQLAKVPLPLRNDDGVVYTAIRANALAIEFASDRLRCDPQMGLEAVRLNAASYPLLHDQLKAKYDFRLKAVQANGGVIEYMDDKDRDDPVLARAAVENDVNIFRLLSPSMRADREITALAISKIPGKVRSLLSPLITDPDFMLDMLRQKKLTLAQLPHELHDNEEFMQSACHIPGVDLREIPHSLAQTPTFRQLRAAFAQTAPATPPVLEREGLRYQWVRNVEYDSVRQLDRGVQIANPTKMVVRDALLGPAHEAPPGQAGLYCLKK